jgi:lantibiotic biosynthesis protein
LGISAIQLNAAIVTGRSDWKSEAIELALACARRPNPLDGIRDGCLCHGFFSAGHIFNRLFQATLLEEFRTMANRMYAHGLSIRTNEPSAAGFLKYSDTPSNFDPMAPWKAEYGLLDGIAGIGLAILASITEVEPKWDSHMCINLAPLKK